MTDMIKYYPWGGDFTSANPKSTVAVVLLNTSFIPSDNVAIYGHLKTENIGIEKIIANVISNPHIRYVLICGDEIRGHRSGQSLIALHENGIDDQHRIINAPGAIPYIENLDKDAIHRFQRQVQIKNLIDISDEKKISETIEKMLMQKKKVFGKPFIAIRLVKESASSIDDKRALHSKIIIDYMGNVKKRP